MALRSLPRYALDLRHLGVNEAHPTWLTGGLPTALFPHDAATGGDGGEGGDGSGGDDGDGEDDGPPAKRTSDMTPEEQAEYWKKQSRKHERAAKSAPTADELKALREAHAELEKIRDSQRTDTEKVTARAEKAEKELGELKPRLLRMEVAYETGLPKELAHRLVGNTKEELEADAKELMKLSGAGSNGSAGKRTGSLDQGTRNTREESKASVASGAELYAQRHRKTTTAS